MKQSILRRHFHIAICGNVGVGKSTLAKLLQSQMNGQIILENPENFPFVEDAFDDPLRWGFSNQMQFLVSKIIDQGLISKMNGLILQEMDIVATHRIWTPVLEDMGFISKKEVLVVNQTYGLKEIANISIPNLYIVLKGNPQTIIGRIVSRNRDYESRFSDTLRLVNALEQHVQEFSRSIKTPSISIDTSTVNILEANLDEIIEQISLAMAESND